MTKRALVTGGAGFIGSHVYDLFSANGWEAHGLDDLSSGKRANLPDDANLHVLDVRSPEAAALVRDGGFDIIVHLAAQMDVRRSVADPTFDASVNIVGTLNLLEALRASGRGPTTRVVFSSTGGAIYGDLAKPPNSETTPKEPDSPYAIAKLSVEHYLAYYARIHAFDTVSVRFGNVYGPRQDPHGEAGVVAIFCGRILAGKPLTIFGDGTQTRDYVHVADVADAIYRVGTGTLPTANTVNDRAFNIGTGEAATVLEVANSLLTASGATAPIEFAPARAGEQMHSWLAIDKARSLLGWNPRVSLADGLADTFRWSAAGVARLPEPA
ncbi:MAG: NAD-dependent epimerase/dehydratase family protein [Gemmatimonadaceae bacterium]